MSSPLASLSKTRKVPLQSEPVDPGRGIRIYGDEDEVDMPNDGPGSEEQISVPSCYSNKFASVSGPGPPYHDSDLARKMQQLEQQVKAQSDELVSKDQKILALEDLVQRLQQNQGEVSGQRQEELQTMCTQLQRQVGEMERFLNDYGLQWVGEPMDQEDSEDKTVSEEEKRDWMTAKKFWKPGDSLVPPEVDFDRLLASLQDLSELVVEGDTQVTPVPGGAWLHSLEPIPLKLYRNGIMMFDGPFRPFYDPSTQRCLRDILDGFFPSELQRLYPDGVPFKVSDLRNQVYPEEGLGPFPGEGRVVGRPKVRKASDRVEEYPGSRMTAEKFLNRLPKVVIRQGQVIDIRGPIRDTLQNYCPLPARIQETIVETPALVAERERSQQSPNTPAPPLSMLRIKSENGEQVFLLMMWPNDTIGDVRALLTQARWAQGRGRGCREAPAQWLGLIHSTGPPRGMDAATFEIFSTFPLMVYQDDTLTLQAAGLVPNATLLLRPCRAPLSDPGPNSSSSHE
ncbi:UBX domain-containing protein 11 isoform X2 [Marmota monax]|uniref:UBX domain-containing protein 11 isoform X2 n=1 Tax=Marmota monax TaxID=9995 RepID=UPI001EB00E0E|nr:UBX domain-containing protein 11 isoform X2 [Marmota monax]XP_058427022.1 UBX domain-containing protein 11 isoform X2 [Marmota monax]